MGDKNLINIVRNGFYFYKPKSQKQDYLIETAFPKMLIKYAILKNVSGGNDGIVDYGKQRRRGAE